MAASILRKKGFPADGAWCSRRRELLRYASNFNKRKRITTLIFNANNGQMLNDVEEKYIYGEEDWKKFFDKKFPYKKLDEEFYFHNFEEETFIFKVSSFENIFFFYGFFVERNHHNRLQLLSILAEFIYSKRNVIQHG